MGGEWPVDPLGLEECPSCVICLGRAHDWDLEGMFREEYPKGGYTADCTHCFRPFVHLTDAGWVPVLKFGEKQKTNDPCNTREEAEATARSGARSHTARLQAATVKVVVTLLKQGFSPQQLNSIHVIAMEPEAAPMKRPSVTHSVN